MITTAYTANVLVAHRQAELRAQGRSIRIARDARRAGQVAREAGQGTGSALWSLSGLTRRLNLSGRRRPALV